MDYGVKVAPEILNLLVRVRIPVVLSVKFKMIPLEYLTDGHRHLICLPYSRHNLERMARDLGLGKHWFHKDHYDIPVRRKTEIEAKCRMVSTRDIIRIIKGSELSGARARLESDEIR